MPEVRKKPQSWDEYKTVFMITAAAQIHSNQAKLSTEARVLLCEKCKSVPMGPTTSTAEGERSTKQMGLNQEGVETERKHSSRHVFLRNLRILDFFVVFLSIGRCDQFLGWSM